MMYKNLAEYRRGLTQKIKAMRNNKNKSPEEAAKIMTLLAKKGAARKSGETIAGIRKRKTNNGWSVESWVPGRFKQNLFQNRTVPFRYLHYKNKSFSKYYANNQIVQYGESAKSPSGKQISWLGEPMFFDKAAIQSKKEYDKEILKNTRKALRGEFV